MPPVHRHERQVYVNDEVGLGRALVQRDLLALGRLADVDIGFGILAVVLVEAVGPEGAEDAVADDVADLVGRHPAMQAQGGDEVDVLHARLRGHVDDLFHDQLANVGRGHRGERQREIVERDGQLHAFSKQ